MVQARLLSAAKAALVYVAVGLRRGWFTPPVAEELDGRGWSDFEIYFADVGCTAGDCEDSVANRLHRYIDGCLGRVDPKVVIGWSMLTDESDLAEITASLSPVPHISVASRESMQLGNNSFAIAPTFHDHLRGFLNALVLMGKRNMTIWHCDNEQGRSRRDVAIAEGRALGVEIASAQVPLADELFRPPEERSALRSAYDSLLASMQERQVKEHIGVLDKWCAPWDIRSYLSSRDAYYGGKTWHSLDSPQTAFRQYRSTQKPRYRHIGSPYKDVKLLDSEGFAYLNLTSVIEGDVAIVWRLRYENDATLEPWFIEAGGAVPIKSSDDEARYFFDALVASQLAVLRAQAANVNITLRHISTELRRTDFSGLTGRVAIGASGQRIPDVAIALGMASCFSTSSIR